MLIWPLWFLCALAGPFDGSAATLTASSPSEQVWVVDGATAVRHTTPGPDAPPSSPRCAANGVDLIVQGELPAAAVPALDAACRRLTFDAPALIRPRVEAPPPPPRVATADPRVRWGLTAALTLLALPFLRRRWAAVPELLAHAVAMFALSSLVAEALVGSFTFSQFTDRDLTRAWRLPEDFPGAGSEMSGDRGARIPGPALGVLFWLGLQLGTGAPPAFYLALAGVVAGVLVLHGVVWRRLGIATAAITTALWVTHPATLDTLTALWNPTWASPFAGLAVAGFVELLAGERRAGAVTWATGLVLGAQVHMSALLWGGANALVLAGVDREALRRAGRALLAVAVVAYLPYVVDEATSGWPNTHAVLGQATGARTVSQGGASLANASKMARLIVGYPVEGQALRPEQVGVATQGAWMMVAGVAAALVRRSRVSDALIGSLAAVVLAFGLGVFYQVEVRYAAVLAPGVALAAALGVTGLAQRWTRELLAGMLALAAIAATAPLRMELLANRWSLSTAPWSWAVLVGNLDGIRAATGWTLPEVAGRTSWRRVTADGTAEEWRSRPPIDLLLAQAGEVFPGSLPGPCALLVGDMALATGTVLTPERVHELVWSEAPISNVRPSVRLKAEWSLVLYDLADARCPTSMSNRYVDTPVEAQLRRWMPEMTQTGAQPLGDGVTGVVLRHHPTDQGFAWDLAVGVVERDGQLTLESNQLRGYTDNSGWFDPYILRSPTLRYERLDALADPVDVVWEPGLVGAHFALTPLTTPAPNLGPGRWRRTLVGSVVQLRPLPLPATTGDEEAFSVVLDEVGD